MNSSYRDMVLHEQFKDVLRAPIWTQWLSSAWGKLVNFIPRAEWFILSGGWALCWEGKFFTTSFQVSCGWDSVVDWSRDPIVNISSQLHLQWILQLILWSQWWKSANTTNLLLSSQAAKGIKPLHFLSRKEQARTNVSLFSCRERENGHHPHADRLGGGKVSNQNTNVRSHFLCQALSKALYTPNPDTCLGIRTSTSMLLLAESETCIFKTYLKVLHLISFLFYSSLTSLKSFFKMPAKWE